MDSSSSNYVSAKSEFEELMNSLNEENATTQLGGQNKDDGQEQQNVRNEEENSGGQMTSSQFADANEFLDGTLRALADGDMEAAFNFADQQQRQMPVGGEEEGSATSADAGPSCSSSLFSPQANQKEAETAEEDVLPSEIRSLIDDLLSQQPAQLDVIGHADAADVSAQNPSSNRFEDLLKLLNIETKQRPENDYNDNRPHSEPILATDCNKEPMVDDRRAASQPAIAQNQCSSSVSKDVHESQHPNPDSQKLIETDEDIVEIIQEKQTSAISAKSPNISSVHSNEENAENGGNSERVPSRDSVQSIQPILSERQQSNSKASSRSRSQLEEMGQSNEPVEGENTGRCDIDPITNRRFYEPHKRPGCGDEYCLSRVTQIGERICSVENKLAELTELFRELVKEEGHSPEEQLNSGQSLSSGTPQQEVPLPNMAMRSTSTVINPQTYTVRVARPNIPEPPPTIRHLNRTRFLTHTTISGVSPHIISPVSANHNKAPPYRIAVQPQVRSLYGYGISGPPTVPSKSLAHGIRIYFPNNGKFIKGNVCPVCFANFDAIFVLISHLLRHRNQNIPVDFFRCTFCKDAYQVHFLSSAAICEHILNSHGISSEQMLRAIAVTDPKGKQPDVQLELKRFVRTQLDIWDRLRGDTLGRALNSAIKSRSPSVTLSTTASNSATKRRRRTQLEEDTEVDELLFSQSSSDGGLPRNLSERFQWLKNISRATPDEFIVPVPVELLNFTLANKMAQKDDDNEEVEDCSTHSEVQKDESENSSTNKPSTSAENDKEKEIIIGDEMDEAKEEMGRRRKRRRMNEDGGKGDEEGEGEEEPIEDDSDTEDNDPTKEEPRRKMAKHGHK